MQYARNQVFIGAHNKVTDILEVSLLVWRWWGKVLTALLETIYNNLLHSVQFVKSCTSNVLTFIKSSLVWCNFSWKVLSHLSKVKGCCCYCLLLSLTVYYLHSLIFFSKIYDIDVENLPMFVYQLPPGTVDVLLTDRVIFTITHQELSGEVRKLIK